MHVWDACFNVNEAAQLSAIYENRYLFNGSDQLLNVLEADDGRQSRLRRSGLEPRSAHPGDDQPSWPGGLDHPAAMPFRVNAVDD